ncbi:MAG: hypothetical protein QNL04_06025, partial [SAR324 cluster bacterium]|nr:hypothetical protein [SAR324 cluster bacterium]
TDSSSDCVTALDNREFASVSENTSCSDYQRASAYLGRAGFLFQNFLASGASSNYRHALGIADSVTVYSTSDQKTYYEAASVLSGEDTGDNYDGLTRSNALIEIHYFTSLAALMGQTYIELDQDANGTISESEKNDYSKVRDADDSDLGTNDITTTDYLQMTFTNGSVALIDTVNGYCYNDTEAEGVYFSNGNTTTYSSGACAKAANGDSGKCAVIAEVDDIQDMFTESISAGSGNVTSLTTGFVSGLDTMDTDLDALGVPSDSDLREALNDFKDLMDNGGSCTSDTMTEVQQLLDLIDVSQATELTSGDSVLYTNINKIPVSTLSGASDGTVAEADSSGYSCSGSMKARLVFLHPDGTYYPYYTPSSTTDQASSGIYGTFNSLTNIQLDSDGVKKANTAGDEIVSFQELLCME